MRRLSAYHRLKILSVLLMITCVTSRYQAQDSLTVYFPVSGYEINPADKAIIHSFVNNKPETISKIEIRAYCDDTGSESLNFTLSVKRAEALQNHFFEAGLDENVITDLKGMGSLPIKNPSGDVIEERASLRRATAYISYEPVLETADVAPIDEAVVIPPKKNLIRDSVLTGESINLEQVLFVGGTRQILPASKPALQNLVDELQSRPGLHIRIEGHVCCTPPGKDGKDLDTKKNNLSEVRAKAVYDHLVKAGIDESRLEYVGKKGDFPLGGDVINDRRVEIVVTKGGHLEKEY